jgi:hypothetical protein
MKKTAYHIEIDINAETDSGFENSLDEATKNIKRGNVSGMGFNDEEEYSFSVTTEEMDEPDPIADHADDLNDEKKLKGNG